MTETLEISIQKLDEWISGAKECKLLSKPEVFALCNKVGVIIIPSV